MKIVSVAGARPNFMKIAPIVRAIAAHNAAHTGSSASALIEHVLVHTGQHYDTRMSKLFFDELHLPEPKYNLDVRSGSHALQTAEIMRRFEPVILDEQPDFLLVVGDINSTIACALVAKKLGIKVIHVEAGLRSFDMDMPEEINRILTDSISDLLFATEESGVENLLRAGVDKDKIFFVGNVMIDTLLSHLRQAESSDILTQLNVEAQQYAVATLHRPSNVDIFETFSGIMEALCKISLQTPVVFPLHPRTKAKMAQWQIPSTENILFIDPLGYLDFLQLVSKSKLVLTDSGGVQEETTVLGVPCLTLRENTERPVTITAGTNYLCGVNPEIIYSKALSIFTDWKKPEKLPDLWDGNAAERIVSAIVSSKGKR